MKFRPYNNTTVLRRLPQPKSSFFGLEQKTVDLYQIKSLDPKSNTMFKEGDTVTVCAIGTPLGVDDDGTELVLMNLNYITGKI